MAYKLRLDGINDRVTGQSLIALSTFNKIRLEIDFSVSDSLNFDGTVRMDNAVTVSHRSFVEGLDRVRIVSNGTNFGIAGLFPSNERVTIAVEIDQTGAGPYPVSVFINGDLIGTQNATAKWNNNRSLNLWPLLGVHDYYGVKLFFNDILTVHYDPSASNGTGLVLPDVVSGNNGILTNFDNDNSQWVFYDDGGSTEFTATISSTTLLPTSSVAITNLKPEYTTTIASNALLPSSNVALESIAPAYNVTITSNATLPTSTVSLDNEVPQNSIILNSNTLLPSSVVSVTGVLPEYSVDISSGTLLPTSVVSITNIKPEFVLSVNSSTPIPSSTVVLTAIGAGDYVTTISSSALLPASVLELDTLAPVGISIASGTPLPFGEVTLDYENYSISVSSNTLLPSGSVELDNTIPEYSADITSSTKLPTSIVFLVNGEVIKNINPFNIIKVQYRNNTVSARQPNNITTPSHNNIIKLRN